MYTLAQKNKISTHTIQTQRYINIHTYTHHINTYRHTQTHTQKTQTHANTHEHARAHPKEKQQSGAQQHVLPGEIHACSSLNNLHNHAKARQIFSPSTSEASVTGTHSRDVAAHIHSLPRHTHLICECTTTHSSSHSQSSPPLQPPDSISRVSKVHNCVTHKLPLDFMVLVKSLALSSCTRYLQ